MKQRLVAFGLSVLTGAIAALCALLRRSGAAALKPRLNALGRDLAAFVLTASTGAVAELDLHGYVPVTPAGACALLRQSRAVE